MNNKLRLRIVEIITKAQEGHIPSSLSIVDIIDYLYGEVLVFNKRNPNYTKRDYFILSKGHGCAALYTVLEKYELLHRKHLESYSKSNSILGGHPDSTKVPFIEASTGSLGHGFPMAVGIAISLKIKKLPNKVFVLLGDGECHEGTIWESANIAANQNLENLCAIIDWNKSAEQLMPKDNLKMKWKAFGWDVKIMNGHSLKDFKKNFKNIRSTKKPTVILAHTTKGKGINFMEGHGIWHHKIPNIEEYNIINKVLNNEKA
jgi:transketolase